MNGPWRPPARSGYLAATFRADRANPGKVKHSARMPTANGARNNMSKTVSGNNFI